MSVLESNVRFIYWADIYIENNADFEVTLPAAPTANTKTYFTSVASPANFTTIEPFQVIRAVQYKSVPFQNVSDGIVALKQTVLSTQTFSRNIRIRGELVQRFDFTPDSECFDPETMLWWTSDLSDSDDVLYLISNPDNNKAAF